MELKEISLAELLNDTSGTEYFSFFAKLIGRSEDSVFYEGISDQELGLLEELESALGEPLPSHYLEFLNYLNGGHFINIDLFSLADKNYSNSLIARNFYSSIREELNLEENILIIGKFEHYIIYVECGEGDSSYTLMDIRNNEKIEFQSLGALIGFIFYMLIIKENKKIEEEKKEIEKMKEKMHNDFKKKSVSIKKETEKNRAKLRAKVANKALKEKMRKLKRNTK